MSHRKRTADLVRYSHLGIQFALVVAMAVFGGVWLDRRFGTSPLLTITGTAVFEWFGVAQPIQGDVTPEMVAQRGSVELVGESLFTDYLLPFEFTSVLLLIGIVGVITLGGWKKVQHRERKD